MASDWDAQLYDRKHSFVTAYGAELLELLQPRSGETVLDVGCGTGHLSAAIHEAGATVVGIDASPAMLEIARRDHPGTEFLIADASDFDLGRSFDAVFSNAALHWVQDAEGAVRCMARALRAGGRFVGELGGKGNIARLIGALFDAFRSLGCENVEHSWYFPALGEYASLMERHGIEATAAWLFDRPTRLEGADGLRDWYRQFASAVRVDADDDCWAEAIARAETALRPSLYVEGEWIADYRRLRIVGRKSATAGDD